MKTIREVSVFIMPCDLLQDENYVQVVDQLYKDIYSEEYKGMIKQGCSDADARLGAFAYTVGVMSFYVKALIREYHELEKLVKDR